MNRDNLEKEITKKRLNAPRLTPAIIEGSIASEEYHTFPDTLTTVCCLKLKNGYGVVGVSGCASPENFNEEIGKKVAREKAKDKIWSLEGYLLKETLFKLEQST